MYICLSKQVGMQLSNFSSLINMFVCMYACCNITKGKLDVGMFITRTHLHCAYILTMGEIVCTLFLNIHGNKFCN